MNEGWIMLYRSLLQSNLFDNEKMLKIFIWCLCKAAHKQHRQQIGRKTVLLEPGQFVTGRNVAAIELHMKPSTVWAYLLTLKNNKNVDIISNNKFSIVTVENWGVYQIKTKNDDNKYNNKQTTNEQQTDTNNNVNNVININKEEETTYGKSESGEIDIDILNFYKENISKNISLIESKKLFGLQQKYNKELILKAIDTAVLKNAKNLGYILAILMDWKNKGLDSIEKIDSYLQNWQSKNKKVKENYEKKINRQANGSYKNKKDIPNPNFNNYDQRNYDYNKLEKRLLGEDATTPLSEIEIRD